MRVTVRGEQVELHGTASANAIFGDFPKAMEPYGVVIASDGYTQEELTVACRHVLAVMFGDHEAGEQPGGFITSLIETILRADASNAQRLALGFPAYTAAVELYKTVPYGEDALRVWATQTPATTPGDGSSPKEEKEDSNG